VNIDSLSARSTRRTLPSLLFKYLLPRSLAFAATLAIAACAIGPDYRRPSVQIPESFKQGVDWQRAQANPQGSLSSNWWTLYHDDELSQLIERSMKANQSIVAAEAAYRVFIEELPPAASASQGRKGTVAVVGRFALPVFIVPAGAKGKLAIDSVSAKGGTFSVKLSNAGASRVHLAHLVAGAKETEATLTNPYLLPGTSREVSGPLGAACKPGATVKVVATADGGQKAEKELVLPPDACRN